MDFNTINFDLPKNKSASIKVIGVGGGGSNAVNYMFQQGITGVDFVVSNTDNQALNNSPVPTKIQLGASITEGLGAGANPEIGEQAALESIDDIKNLLDTNTKMLFITAGMGGGTGTGAAPIIANIAKDMGILTVGICTAPFYFEGKMRVEQAKKGIEKFRNSVDSLIIINNDKLRELYGNLSYKTGFAKADEILATAAKGIAEVITHHYSTNIDLRDAKTVLADSGTAIMGSARAHGEQKAKKAIELALDSPLLNDNKITGARNVLLLIVSGNDEVTMDEIGTINDYIQQEAGHNANIIMGIGEDEDLGDDISVTVIATGFPVDQQDFNGKEDEQIVHVLEDEPIRSSFKRTSSPENKLEEKKEESAPVEKTEPKEVQPKVEEPRFNFEEEDEDDILDFKFKSIDETPSTEKDNGPSFNFSLDDDFQSPSSPSQPKNNPNPTPEVKKDNTTQAHAQSSKYTLHTLEDDWEDEMDTPISVNQSTEKEIIEEPKFNWKEETPKMEEAPKVEEKPVVEEKTMDEEAFDAPISANISQQIQERRERLKKFNFKFKNKLNDYDVDEVERIPAYKRNQIELSEHKREKSGGYIIDRDTSNEIKIRPNNFLHDNVD